MKMDTFYKNIQKYKGKNIIKLVIAVEKGRDLPLSQVGLFVGWFGIRFFRK